MNKRKLIVKRADDATKDGILILVLFVLIMLLWTLPIQNL